MITFFLRRLIYSLFVILGVTLITYFIFNGISGDPALLYAGKNASPELIESLRHELGLDRSHAAQYFSFLKQTFTFDWGTSWSTHRNINKMILDSMGATLSLTLPAFSISSLLAILISLFSIQKPHSWIVRRVPLVALTLMSVSFLIYIIYLQKFFAFDLNLFPIYGWDPSWSGRWAYITLPGFIYGLVHIGPKTLLFRSALHNEAEQDYVRTAQAKGLTQTRIYHLHVLKNAAPPILTLLTAQMPTLITGSLLLEAFFGIPGLGGMLINAIHSSDFPVIKAMTVLGSITYIFFNLMNDLLIGWIDVRREIQ